LPMRLSSRLASAPILLHLLTAAYGTKGRSLLCTPIGRKRSEADMERRPRRIASGADDPEPT
jgi:hypothetical protein